MKRPQGCAAGERLAGGNPAEPQGARWVLGSARLPPGRCSWGSRSTPSQLLALLLTPALLSLPAGFTDASSQGAAQLGGTSWTRPTLMLAWAAPAQAGAGGRLCGCLC